MRMYSFLFLLFWALAFSCSRESTKKVSVSPPLNYKNVKIDVSKSFTGPCEPSIAINPKNPQNIVAGSVLDNVYVSNDGGLTWDTDKLTSTSGVYGDPVIRADNQGNFYYSHLSNPTGKAWQDVEFLDRIVIQKSSDGGKTWNDGSFTRPNSPKDQDKQWLALDPNDHSLYMTWTEFDLYDSKDPKDHSRIMFAKSTDNGISWTDPKSMEKDIVVSEQPGGWDYMISGISRCNGMTITQVDQSKGPHEGTIYINWSDQRNGENDTDIWISKSTDGGNTWSAAKRVNDDPPGKHQFFTWMDVDPITGYIYIVFYDRRNDAEDLNETDVYLAYSKDGGENFSNVKISESPFIPKPTVFFGDYNDISAHDGMIRPIWTRQEGMRLSVWTAILEIK